MKAQELRIGNTVCLDSVNKSVNILWIKPDKVCVMKVRETYPSAIVDFDRLLPIPLTEERLLKFGFEYDEDKGFSSDESERKIYSLNGFDVSIEEEGEIKMWNEMSEDKWYSSYGIKIRYVHQLQNLYFALTGYELQLK